MGFTLNIPIREDQLQASLKSAQDKHDRETLNAAVTLEGAVRESVDAEIKADIQSLRTDLSNEVTLRANNDATLKSALDTEKTERIACDTAVVNSIRNYYDPKIDSLATALENEITLSASRDNSALASSLAAETSARIVADNSLSFAVNAEKSARQSDTSTLQSTINNEKTALQSDTAKLTASIAAEKSARESDTSTLRTLINNEVNARQSHTAKLSSSIESAVANIKDYVPATDNTAGTHGFVPAPPVNSKKMILTHDGGWQEISEAIPSLSPRILTKPTLKKADLFFNFREQSPELKDFDSDTMTIKGIDSAINVGSYTIIVAIKDKTRCFWDLETEDVEDVVFEWNIVKNNLIPKPTLQAVTEGSYTTTKNSTTYITFDYDGTVKTCEPIFADDYPGLNYVNVTGNFSEVNADEYIITVSLKDIKQTCWKDGTVSTVRLYFRIVPAKLTVEQSTFTQTETLTYSPGVTYTIFDVFPTLDSDFYVISDSAVTETSSAGSFYTQVKTDDNHTYSNGTTSKYVHWKIDKRIVKEPILIAEGIDGGTVRFPYDGTSKEVQVYGFDSDVAYISSDSVLTDTSAGANWVHIYLSDPDNYIWEKQGNSNRKSFTWIITKITPELSFSERNIVFDSATSEAVVYVDTVSDGELKVYLKGDTDVAVCTINNEDKTVTVTRGTKAGTSKIIFRTADTGNCFKASTSVYVTYNPTTTLTAEQSTFTQEQTLIYNPNRTYNFYDAILNYNSNYLTASGDLTAKNAGTYTVLIAPKEGYTFNDGSTAAKTVTWKIDKATIDKPVAEGIFSFIYDGSAKTPIFSQQTSWDLLTKSGDVSKTNAGSYVIKFDITDKNNCCWTEDSGTATVPLVWEITKATLTAPTLSNTTHTYNGNTKSPTINNFDPDTMNKSGPESAINANTYTITFTVKNSNYQFPGGVSSVPRTWTINKASQSITLSTTRTTFDNDTDTFEITATYEGTGTLSITYSADETPVIARLKSSTHTATGTATTVTLQATKFGNTYIYFTVAESNNHYAASRVSLFAISQYCRALDLCSYPEIQSIIKAGKAQVAWRVGDYKSVGGSGLYDYNRMMILGFNHNSSVEANGLSYYVDFALVKSGNPAVMSQGILNGNDQTPVASTDTNVANAFNHYFSDKTSPSSYYQSRFYSWHCIQCAATLPSPLRQIIINPKKDNAVKTQTLWLLNATEVRNFPSSSIHKQYDYFKNGNFIGANFWLRDYVSKNQWKLQTVTSSIPIEHDGSTCNGFLPCFRIG